MNTWWVTSVLQNQGPAMLVAWCIIVIGSIVLHELAHGWFAIRLGDTTPIETGHMTWNPVVHMGWFNLMLFALLGITGGAMPVDPSRLRGRYGDAQVSFAGPAMNLAIAIVSVVMIAGVLAWSPPSTTTSHTMEFFHLAAYLNLSLAMFNLLPVPPLDGWRIASSFFPNLNRLTDSEAGKVLAVIAFLALFRYAPSVLFPLASEVTSQAAVRLAVLLAGGGGGIGTP